MLQRNVSAFSSDLPAFYPAENRKGRTQYMGKETETGDQEQKPIRIWRFDERVVFSTKAKV